MPLSIRPVDTAEDETFYNVLSSKIFQEPAAPTRPGDENALVDYIAFQGASPVGIGSIRYSADETTSVTLICNIGVAPEHRRAGYGRRIVMHLCAEANRLRPNQDRIITPHSENAPFYEMFGFVAEGDAPGDDEGPRVQMRQSAIRTAPQRRIEVADAATPSAAQGAAPDTAPRTPAPKGSFGRRPRKNVCCETP